MNKLLGLLALILFIGFTSCSQDELGTTENFTDDSTEKICRDALTGDKGCFEFVYPITISFADGSKKEVASHDSLKSAIKAWRIANPGSKERPTIALPYAVTTSDGTIVTITNDAEKRALLATCRPKGKDHPGKGNGDGRSCFSINFPYSIKTDSAVITITSKEDIKSLLNRKDRRNYQFVYPITITLKDGTVKTINSLQDLIAVKEACRK
jgi:hypothetical protein